MVIFKRVTEVWFLVNIALLPAQGGFVTPASVSFNLTGIYMEGPRPNQVASGVTDSSCGMVTLSSPTIMELGFNLPGTTPTRTSPSFTAIPMSLPSLLPAKCYGGSFSQFRKAFSSPVTVTFSDSSPPGSPVGISNLNLTIPSGVYSILGLYYSGGSASFSTAHAFSPIVSYSGTPISPAVCSSTTSLSFQSLDSACSSASIPLTSQSLEGTSSGYMVGYFPGSVCIYNSSIDRPNFCPSGTTPYDLAKGSVSLVFSQDLYHYFYLTEGATSPVGSKNQTDLMALNGTPVPMLVYSQSSNGLSKSSTLGASVHLTHTSPVTNLIDGEMSLIFDKDPKGTTRLISAMTSAPSFVPITQTQTTSLGYTAPAGISGVCPSAGYLPSVRVNNSQNTASFIQAVARYNSATGNLAFRGSSGINYLSLASPTVASTVTVRCAADSDGATLSQFDSSFSAYLGYSYSNFSGGSGYPGQSSTWTVARVVDPGSILKGSHGAVTPLP